MKRLVKVSVFLLGVLMILASLCSCIRIDTPIKKGVISDDRKAYYNESLGIEVSFKTRNTGFSIQSTQEIQNLMDGLEFKEALKKANISYDLYAYNNSNGASVTILFENLYRTLGKVVDDAKYLEIAKKNLIDQLPAADMRLVSTNTKEFKVAGQTLNGLLSTIEYKGVYLYEYSIIKRVGNYMAVITLTAPTKQYLETMLNSFSEYKK